MASPTNASSTGRPSGCGCMVVIEEEINELEAELVRSKKGAGQIRARAAETIERRGASADLEAYAGLLEDTAEIVDRIRQRVNVLLGKREESSCLTWIREQTENITDYGKNLSWILVGGAALSGLVYGGDSRVAVVKAIASGSQGVFSNIHTKAQGDRIALQRRKARLLYLASESRRLLDSVRSSALEFNSDHSIPSRVSSTDGVKNHLEAEVRTMLTREERIVPLETEVYRLLSSFCRERGSRMREQILQTSFDFRSPEGRALEEAKELLRVSGIASSLIGRLRPRGGEGGAAARLRTAEGSGNRHRHCSSMADVFGALEEPEAEDIETGRRAPRGVATLEVIVEERPQDQPAGLGAEETKAASLRPSRETRARRGEIYQGLLDVGLTVRDWESVLKEVQGIVDSTRRSVAMVSQGRAMHQMDLSIPIRSIRNSLARLSQAKAHAERSLREEKKSCLSAERINLGCVSVDTRTTLWLIENVGWFGSVISAGLEAASDFSAPLSTTVLVSSSIQGGASWVNSTVSEVIESHEKQKGRLKNIIREADRLEKEIDEMLSFYGLFEVSVDEFVRVDSAHSPSREETSGFPQSRSAQLDSVSARTGLEVDRICREEATVSEKTGRGDSLERGMEETARAQRVSRDSMPRESALGAVLSQTSAGQDHVRQSSLGESPRTLLARPSSFYSTARSPEDVVQRLVSKITAFSAIERSRRHGWTRIRYAEAIVGKAMEACPSLSPEHFSEEGIEQILRQACERVLAVRTSPLGTEPALTGGVAASSGTQGRGGDPTDEEGRD